MKFPKNKQLKTVNKFVFSPETELEDIKNTCLWLAFSLRDARDCLIRLRYDLFESEDAVNELIDKTLKEIQ